MTCDVRSGWSETLVEGGGVVYCNRRHNLVQQEHPFDGYYKELYKKYCS